ncbi:MAG TPA: ComEC/Rec2 family competence protein [Thermoleophilia bacterium]|nr:ComEC/Rec2 family competence protein [Thermoleophilia bacterium]
MTRTRLSPRALVSVALAAAILTALVASGCGGSDGAEGSAAQGGAGGAVATGSPSATGRVTGTPGPAPTPTRSPKATPAAGATTAAGSTGASTAGGSPALRVVFVDVGQGDAAVLRSGAWTGLVDGGPAGSEGAIEAALAKLGVRRLDTLVISHLHADHTGGLPALVAEYRPRRALVAGAVRGGLAAALRGAGTAVVQARRGLTKRFGTAKATVLAPGGLSGDANTDSIVLELDAAGRRVVFTGDATGAGETAAGATLARGPPVDVLKVSHHGSRYSTTTGFLAGARPRTAVISVGSNTYGHPSSDAVKRLRAGGARVFSTRRSGSITLTVTAAGGLRWSYARSGAQITRGISRGDSSSGTSGGGSGAAATSAAGAASSSASASGATTVYVTNTGECYHQKGCRYLSSSRIAMKLSHAKADGYRPCSVCDPPR